MKTRLEWGLWLYGLIYAFVGGGATSLTSGVVVTFSDPAKFNLSDPGPLIKLMCAVFVVGGLPSFFGYLKQHPLPSIITVTETKTTTMRQDPPAIVEQTVKTTEEKPQEQPKP